VARFVLFFVSLDMSLIEHSKEQQPTSFTLPPLTSWQKTKLLHYAEQVLSSQQQMQTHTGKNILHYTLLKKRKHIRLQHYPLGDRIDLKTGGQYFYHCHRENFTSSEHGHFHCFLRKTSIQKRIKPTPLPDWEIAGHERVGRPHFAQVLINEGLVLDMKVAFKRFLGQGKPAFVPTLWASIDEVVLAIVHAGGQAVIAHPLKYSLTRSKLHELIQAFKEAGGLGIEVVSGEMTAVDIAQLVAICTRFDLLASSGSDFHSETGSRVGLGRQKPLPANCVPIWQQWNE